MVAVTVSTDTLCGFCNDGNHKACAIGVKYMGRQAHAKYPNGIVWACRCTSGGCTQGRRKCAVCGNRVTEEVNPETWQCFDVEACQAVVETRRENSPFLAQLREIKERVEMAKVQEAATKKKATSPKTGTCVCGCEGTTKGGKFLPGHDARFVSSLVSNAAESNFSNKSVTAARKSLTSVGASDALQAKFEKSLGLAQERAEKREQAKAEKAKGKG